MKAILVGAVLAFAFFCCIEHSAAHGDSPTTVTLSPKGKTGWTVILEANLIEFHEVIDLPLSATGNQGIRFNKQFAKRARPYVEPRLNLASDGQPCTLKKIKTVKSRDHHALGLKLTMRCQNRSRSLTLTYDLFTENDPSAGAQLKIHKGKTTLPLVPGKNDFVY